MESTGTGVSVAQAVARRVPTMLMLSTTTASVFVATVTGAACAETAALKAAAMAVVSNAHQHSICAVFEEMASITFSMQAFPHLGCSFLLPNVAF